MRTLPSCKPILDRIAATGVMNRIGGQDCPASDGRSIRTIIPPSMKA
jgi:hypothetical protein